MYIPGTIIVNEKQADVFELEKIKTKILKFNEKYLCLDDKIEDIIFRIDILIHELS